MIFEALLAEFYGLFNAQPAPSHQDLIRGCDGCRYPIRLPARANNKKCAQQSTSVSADVVLQDADPEGWNIIFIGLPLSTAEERASRYIPKESLTLVT
jgi:LSD1 subclass zinc finger protein